MTMTFAEISLSRLVSQQVCDTKLKTAKEMVTWMGAMQSQDFSMAKWAVGVRLPGATQASIEDAIANGDIIRTHVLRPTWHFVSPGDISWMLDLSAPHIKASMKSRLKELELTDKVLTKSKKIIERAVSAGSHLTRDELITQLEKSKVVTGDQRASHILLAAELDKIICSGPTREKKVTYGCLPDSIHSVKKLTRDEALGALANRYFRSHGPATIFDFTWWSGLPVADARKALEMVKGNFISEILDGKTYWFLSSLMLPKVLKDSVYLLPAFDEFLISYKDRNASLSALHQKQTTSINGIFWPIIVINGMVTGLWKRTIGKSKATVQLQFFRGQKKQSKEVQLLLKETSGKVSEFFSRHE